MTNNQIRKELLNALRELRNLEDKLNAISENTGSLRNAEAFAGQAKGCLNAAFATLNLIMDKLGNN